MALYIPHSIFQLARLLYVRPENLGPYYVQVLNFYFKIYLQVLNFYFKIYQHVLNLYFKIHQNV